MEQIEKIGYRDVLRQKEYVKMMLSNIINRFGDSVDVIAFEWLVYQITGSAAWAAVIFGINTLPTLLLQPFAGVLVEGMNKKKIIIVTDCIRGIITVGLVLLCLTGNVTPYFLAAFTLLNSTVEAFSLPAGTALLPKILEEKYYTYGTSLSSAVSTVVQLIGMGAGGIIISIFGIWVAILIDAVSFFASALVRSFITIKEQLLQKEIFLFSSYKQHLLEGIDYLKTSPAVRNFCIMAVFINAAIVPFNALQTPLAYEVLGQGSEMLSTISVSFTLGMILGSLMFPTLSKQFSVRTNVVLFGILVGTGIASYTVGSRLHQTLAIYFLAFTASLFIGIGISVISTLLSVQFMKTVKQDYLARVSSIFNAAATAAMPLTSFLLSILATKFRTWQILIGSGVICVLLFIYVGVRKIRLE